MNSYTQFDSRAHFRFEHNFVMISNEVPTVLSAKVLLIASIQIGYSHIEKVFVQLCT